MRGSRPPPGRDEVMPPGEEEGGRQAGGGGRREEQSPGGGFEGQRGREAGSVGGEGEEARGWGRGGRARAGSQRWQRREEASRAPGGPQCALLRSLLFARISPPRLPSLLYPGLEPQTLRHNSPAGAGGEATAKLSANFTAWRDLGCEGGGARLTQVARPKPPARPPSRFFLPRFQQPSIRYFHA